MKLELTDQEKLLLEQVTTIKKINQTYLKILECNDDSFVSRHQVIWQQNNSRVLYYPGKNHLQEEAILVIPSLINRAYILDISEHRSVLGYLQKQSLDCYLLDWGDPLEAEKDHTFEDYYNYKVVPVLQLLRERGVSNFTVLGHCLGGVLALAVAQLNQDVRKLALINVPWDFSHYQPLLLSYKTMITDIAEHNSLISSLYVRQFLMVENNSYLWYDKLVKIDDNSVEGQLAIKVEKWSLDNLYITRGVFLEISEDFVGKNKLYHGGLTINGVTIKATKELTKPVFVVLSLLDQVVPYESGWHLKNDHQLSQLRLLESGHLSAILSKDAEQKIWSHFVRWSRCI